MNSAELLDALHRTSPNDRGAIDTLVRRVVSESRALPRTLAAHLNDPDANTAANALSVLIQIDDIGTTPLLEAPESKEAYYRFARINAVVSSQIEVRNTTVSRLKSMLSDKRPMAYGIDPRIEERPPESRVCDEAYVLLRRLLNTSEDIASWDANRRAFFSLPVPRRDAEIQKVHFPMKTWPSFTGSEIGPEN